MQELTADLFVSVDGWARGETSPGYFGYPGPDLEAWISQELDRAQHVLLGRRTYEMLAAVPEAARDESWRRMTELSKTVVSRTLTEAAWANTKISSADLVSTVRELKADGEVPLRTMGSLSVVRQLLAAGLVDRLRLVVFPLLVGPGGREAAFDGVGAADLELVGHQVLDGRLLLTEYRPTGHPIPGAS